MDFGAHAYGLVMHIVCFSHLRWNFVYQRPQQLLSRAARDGRVLYIEEPQTSDTARLDVVRDRSGVEVLVPMVPSAADEERTRLVAGMVATVVSIPMLALALKLSNVFDFLMQGSGS